MNPMQAEQQPLRRLQVTHGKDADESNAAEGDVSAAQVSQEPQSTTSTTVATTITTTGTTVVDDQQDIHEQDAHQQAHDKEPDEQTQQEYEAQFPSEPETPKAATTFALFSNPNRFSLDSIHESTHYLTDALEGTLWHDFDSNGIRGSSTDSTLNAIEYDTGIGGVKVQLVKCDTNELAKSGISLPNNGVGVSSSLKKTQVAEAGEYAFPLENIEAGRYYVMYQAPTDYRITGNVLPLERETVDAYFECIPKGGEGGEYMNEVKEKGDLDLGGYCARSIGCLEVGKQFDLKEEYKDIQVLDGDEDKYVGTTKNLVALPSKSMLNVGLSEEEWPLNTHQYADAKIVLSFASTVTSEDLSAAVPQDFASSEMKRNLETTLAKMFQGEGSAFTVQGVHLLDGEISSTQDSEETPPSRMLRGLQRDVAALPQNTATSAQVTYTLTTWGSYSPPPFEQLGTIISDSINADPTGLVKSLQDKESKLPPVFEEVDDSNARHLTTKVEKKQPGPIGAVQVFNEAKSSEGKMATWATVPIILMAFLIAALTGVLLFRRIFTRRVKKVKNNPLQAYLKRGRGFAVSKYHPEDDTKKSKVVRDPPGVKPSGGFDDRTFKMQALSTELSDEEKPCSESNNSSSTQGSRNTKGSRGQRSSKSHLSSLRSSGQSTAQSTSRAPNIETSYSTPSTIETSERRRKKKKKTRKSSVKNEQSQSMT